VYVRAFDFNDLAPTFSHVQTQIKSVGCEYVVVGHSERRHGNIASESDVTFNKKVRNTGLLCNYRVRWLNYRALAWRYGAFGRLDHPDLCALPTHRNSHTDSQARVHTHAHARMHARTGYHLRFI